MKGMKVGILRWPGEISRVTLPKDLFTSGPDLEWLATVSDYAEGVRAGLPSWGGAETKGAPWFLLIASDMHIRRCAALVGTDGAKLARWIAALGTPNRHSFDEIADEIEAGAELVKMAKVSAEAVDAVQVVTGILAKEAKKKAQGREQRRSAAKKPRRPRVPPDILELHKAEFQSGTEAHKVAGVLAARYNVTPDAVRKAVARSEKTRRNGR